MSTFAGVKKSTDMLEADDTIKEIDTVLLNAGLQNDKYEKTPDGWEETMQVNALGTALLGLMLVPLMRARKPEDERRAAFRVCEFGTACHCEHFVTRFPQERYSRVLQGGGAFCARHGKLRS
jgi:NAD(P)-dependent dehydrogenase (short-subunit alcohol dehydrogenase family)